MQILKLRSLVCVLKSFVVPPSIKGGNVTTEVSALINSIIKLECETRGLPMPVITWYKDGQPVISSAQALYVEKGQFLHIPRAQVSDSATYKCQVTNIAGAAEKSFHVDIYGKENTFVFIMCFLPVLPNTPTSNLFTGKSLLGCVFCSHVLKLEELVL